MQGAEERQSVEWWGFVGKKFIACSRFEKFGL